VSSAGCADHSCCLGRSHRTVLVRGRAVPDCGLLSSGTATPARPQITSTASQARGPSGSCSIDPLHVDHHRWALAPLNLMLVDHLKVRGSAANGFSFRRITVWSYLC